MKKIKSPVSVIVALLAVAVITIGALGANPFYREEIAVGGGTADTVDGGTDLDKAGNVDMSGDLVVRGGDADVGVSGTTRGEIQAFHGAADAPGVLLLKSADGTSYWLFIKNGGALATHNALPGDADGGTIPSLGTAETITANWVNTAFPWADNEVSDDLTITTAKNATIGDLLLQGGDLNDTTNAIFNLLATPTTINVGDNASTIQSVDSLDAGRKLRFVNTSTHTAAFADFELGNTDNASDSLILLTTSTLYTPSGAFMQDAGHVYSSTNLSGGLNIIGRHTTGDVRIYAGGAADGDLVVTFDNAQLTTAEGSVTVKGGTVISGVSATTRGLFEGFHGAGGTTPGAILLHSADGTAYYLHFENGGQPRVSTGLPADATGSALARLDTVETIAADWVNTANPWVDAEVADVLTIGATSTVADGALSANVGLLDGTPTIVGNWVNTANPWADAEVADVLTIGATGSVDLDALAGTLAGNLTIVGDNAAARTITLGQQVTFNDIVNFDIPAANLKLGGVQLNSDGLSDVASIGMLDEAETIAANWVNTANPWVDGEVADDLTINTATNAIVGDLTLQGGDLDDTTNSTVNLFGTPGAQINFGASAPVILSETTNVGGKSFKIHNLDTGSGSFADIRVGNASGSSDALIMFTSSTGYADGSGSFFTTDSGHIYASTNLASLRIMSRGAAADTLFFTGGSAAGDLSLTISDAQLFTFEGNSLWKEASAAVADVLGYGQVWVRDDDPNTLMFTDDLGTDIVISQEPSFSNIWFHSATQATVTISAAETFVQIDSFENIGSEDSGGNVTGSSANDDLTISSGAGGVYDLSYHASFNVIGGASKEMVVAIALELASSLTVTAATNATPIVVTISSHGLLNGDMATISGATGNTAANGDWIVSSVSGDDFTLIDLTGDNSVGNGAYTGSGVVPRIYPGNLVSHREVASGDLGVISAAALHSVSLSGSDQVSLWLANLDDANNGMVAAISLSAKK